MRILAIGGNGFIGTPLVRELVQGGHDVAVLHRKISGALGSAAKQIQGDRNRLRDSEADVRRLSPEIVVDMILSSAKQGQDLVAFTRTLNARVVAVSSMDVYRAWGVLLGTEPGGLEPLPITEDSPLRTATRSYPPDIVKTIKPIFTWLDEERASAHRSDFSSVRLRGGRFGSRGAEIVSGLAPEEKIGERGEQQAVH